MEREKFPSAFAIQHGGFSVYLSVVCTYGTRIGVVGCLGSGNDGGGGDVGRSRPGNNDEDGNQWQPTETEQPAQSQHL